MFLPLCSLSLGWEEVLLTVLNILIFQASLHNYQKNTNGFLTGEKRCMAPNRNITKEIPCKMLKPGHMCPVFLVRCGGGPSSFPPHLFHCIFNNCAVGHALQALGWTTAPGARAARRSQSADGRNIYCKHRWEMTDYRHQLCLKLKTLYCFCCTKSPNWGSKHLTWLHFQPPSQMCTQSGVFWWASTRQC